MGGLILSKINEIEGFCYYCCDCLIYFRFLKTKMWKKKTLHLKNKRTNKKMHRMEVEALRLF